MKKIRIGILGASGMLGLELPALLKRAGLPFIAAARPFVDLSCPEQIEAFLERFVPTHVINCAAYTAVDKAESDRENALINNARAVANLAEAAARRQVRVLHFSTDYVFSGDRMPASGYTEEDSCAPVNYYGLSKYEGELVLMKYLPSSCIVRTSWLFGLHGPNFVGKMLQLFQMKEELKVVHDQIGRPTYAADLGAVAIALLQNDAEGIFHFANSGVTSWHGFAEEILRQAKQFGVPAICKKIIPIPSEEYPTAAVRPKNSILETKKIEKTIGVQFVRPWQEALQEYIKCYLFNG